MSGETYVFDGVLFSENLDFIAKKIAENPGKPIFNYINSIYGHLPHDINYDKRPKVVEIQSQTKDEQLERSANQYFYRTKAIATFVKGLVAVDPKSLIILVSDHLPPLAYGPNTYLDFNYLGGVNDAIHLNRIFIVENGRAVQYSTIHHFDIPKIVLNYVTKGKYCQEHTCDFKSADEPVIAKTVEQHDEYMSIMAQAMGGCEVETPAPPKKEEPVDEEKGAVQHPAAGGV